jgi:hypothetical protein
MTSHLDFKGKRLLRTASTNQSLWQSQVVVGATPDPTASITSARICDAGL